MILLGETCAHWTGLQDATLYFGALESEAWFSICTLICEFLDEAASSSDDTVSDDLITVYGDLKRMSNDNIKAKMVQSCARVY